MLDALDRAWGGTGRAVLTDGEPRTTELALHSDHDDQLLLARLVAEHQADGSRSSVLAVVSDLTAHREALAQLDYERRHDALTGLVNRTRFLEGLEELVGTGGPVALAIADLEDFLSVNDRFGHERGIETEPLRSTLVELGCRAGQGTCSPAPHRSATSRSSSGIARNSGSLDG